MFVSFILCQSIKAAESGKQVTVPEKCTGVYVGKDLCEEGTAIIARSEDMSSGVSNKMFFVHPATDNSGYDSMSSGFGEECG
ncbi:MAG: C69 family dipeptidase [Lachnospiraceae bacterium]|nr:C69 family dipeptidase [Lachnospiraceae bacterium]